MTDKRLEILNKIGSRCWEIRLTQNYRSASRGCKRIGATLSEVETISHAGETYTVVFDPGPKEDLVVKPRHLLFFLVLRDAATQLDTDGRESSRVLSDFFLFIDGQTDREF